MIRGDESEDVHMVIEYVIYTPNTRAIDEKTKYDKANQVTVAWTNVALSDLAKQSKHKLTLKGGSPASEQEIITEED